MKQSADFLVIGSGIAGLCFALHAAHYGTVIIITKKRDIESNTNYAQGGISCVLDPRDSTEAHVRDTLIAGKDLSDENAVRILVEEGPDRIKELLEWGIHFSTSRSSRAYAHLDLGKEGGHTAHRIVHAYDLTGQEVESTLLKRIQEHKNISLYENYSLVELITDHHFSKPRPQKVTCYGVYAFDTETKKTVAVRAKITLLASGGVGQAYRHTTNPEIATGDGIACAYRAGAQIKNMEFIQFHPTAFYHPDYYTETHSFLISEALRGYGAVLKDFQGREFMKKYHPMGSLAPRDVVARAIDNEMKISGEPCMYLDIRHGQQAPVKKRFPTIYAQCKKYGIDITKDLIPVVPAAHYMCGGISVNTAGRTTIGNLYAAGEVACSGVHGANRLASNSLLEALVFAKRAASDAASRIRQIERVPADSIPVWDDSGTIDTEEWILISHNLEEIKNIMWNYVGIVRSTLRLERALRRVTLLEKETENFYRRTKITMKLLELRNIITVAQLIIVSALKRHESRGLHYTTDFPNQDDRNWKHDSIIRKTIR